MFECCLQQLYIYSTLKMLELGHVWLEHCFERQQGGIYGLEGRKGKEVQL